MMVKKFILLVIGTSNHNRFTVYNEDAINQTVGNEYHETSMSGCFYLETNNNCIDCATIQYMTLFYSEEHLPGQVYDNSSQWNPQVECPVMIPLNFLTLFH